jgi:hypothetical protein
MNEVKLFLRDERTAFAPGDTFEGAAGWNLEAAPRSVEARLFWRTQGKGTEDVGVVGRFPFDAPQASEARPFRFTLPAQPWSFSGQLVSLLWAVELVAEPGGHCARIEIVVSPTGREILLHGHAGA